MTDKPVYPGPASSEAERSQYAQDMAKWTTEHPEGVDPPRNEAEAAPPHVPEFDHRTGETE